MEKNKPYLPIDEADIASLIEAGVPQLTHVEYRFSGGSRNGNLILSGILPDGTGYNNSTSGDFGRSWQEADHLELVVDENYNVTSWYYIERIDTEN